LLWGATSRARCLYAPKNGFAGGLALVVMTTWFVVSQSELVATTVPIQGSTEITSTESIVRRRLVCQVRARPTQIVNRGIGRKQSLIENCAPPVCGINMVSLIW